MRKLLGILGTGLLVVGVAVSAQAEKFVYTGTLTLELANLPELKITGGGFATVNNSAGGSHLSTLRLAGGIQGSGTVPVTDPEVTVDGIISIRVTATLGSGTWDNISGGPPISQPTLPVGGLARICLFVPTCGANLPVALTQHTTLSGRKGVGIGGQLTIGGSGLIRVSIEAAPWTLGKVTLLDQTAVFGNIITKMQTGFVHGPASLTSSTAKPSGVVQLISPAQVATNITTGSNDVLALFNRLRIHFVPEPGILLLLGSGVAGLVLLGRQRMRK